MGILKGFHLWDHVINKHNFTSTFLFWMAFVFFSCLIVLDRIPILASTTLKKRSNCWRSYCTARELYPVSWGATWWKIAWEKECIYKYAWVTVPYGRNWHNTINQLYSNNNNINACRPLPLEWISNKILLCSSGNYD